MSLEIPQALQVALRVIDALDALQVRYHIGGSFASSVHGIPRQTQNIDIVVDLTPDVAADLARRLSPEFYADAEGARQAARERRSFNVVHLESGIKVNLFVLGREPFDLEEFRRHRREGVQQEPRREAFVKSAEDTILRKLQWYTMGGEVAERQWSDVMGIARTQADQLDREYLRRWARDLGVDDLLEIVLGSAR